MSRWAPYRGNQVGLSSQVGQTLGTALAFLAEARKWSRDVSMFLRMLSDTPVLQGVLIAGLTTSASATNQEFPHALGRSYRGGFVLEQSNGSLTVNIVAPSAASDSSKVFVVRPTSATAVTFSVWLI